MEVQGRPVALWVLVIALGQLSLRALLGGAALVVAPSGDLVGLPPGPIAGTPFANYLVPGIVLLLAFGLVPAAVCYGLVARCWWGRPGAGASGVALAAWVLVEVALGFVRPTIYLNFVTAVVVAGLTLHPSLRGDAARE